MNKGNNIKRDNHYVPRIYLKQWEAERKVWTCRTLVSNKNVPLWSPQSRRKIAFQTDLYTRITESGEIDDIERWFDQNIENPFTEVVLPKILNEHRLTRSDWRLLARYYAAQSVRTPASLLDFLPRWEKELPLILDKTLKKFTTDPEANASKLRERSREPLRIIAERNEHLFPLSVQCTPGENGENGIIECKTILGRAIWLYSIKIHLESTINVLYKHHWSILYPPKGYYWLTSDNPAVRLNYHEKGYNFNGGWGRKKIDLFLPISPRHLLYTCIGDKVPKKKIITKEKAKLFNKITAQHAHRMIFSIKPIENIEYIRPRIVDQEMYEYEKLQWKEWHEKQIDAEKKLI